MSILDEDRIDFELLESLVAHIDEAHPLEGGGAASSGGGGGRGKGEAGAILVFLPGERGGTPASRAFQRCRQVSLPLTAPHPALPSLPPSSLLPQAWARSPSCRSG